MSRPSKVKGAARVRCAIYTRKSSEEGLDQHFNSLHAQREACEAYVLSQAGEGWSALPDVYDDGGFSGGTMERPALKRLLRDLAAGKIDVVVVYKIDRLTRSLMDFARIVERLDGSGASFVSVTQAFNTTTSMGRLTLNVLLSFAQFEREVTGERIRDKIAASKARGMWMGGMLPLGFDKPVDPSTRALVVNEAEAATVRLIFNRYLELGSVNLLERWLNEQAIRSKLWTTATGKVKGGTRFSRGALIHLLKNRVYLGEIVHRETTRAAAHSAIVPAPLFKAVQDAMAGQGRPRREGPSQLAPAMLKGRIFDAGGRPMSPVFACGRGGRTYRYYVSAPLQKGGSAKDDDSLRRVPGEEADAAVVEALERLTRQTGEQALASLNRVMVDPSSVRLILGPQPGETSEEAQRAKLSRRLLAGESLTTDAHGICVLMPVRLKTRGGRTWLTRPDGQAASGRGRVDKTLVKALAAAHNISREIGASGAGSDHRQARGAGGSYKRGVVPLAFLAPAIQAAIIGGHQPAGLKLDHLLRMDIPLAWADQRRQLGI